MQPIHYSLILNALIIVAGTFLAYVWAQPLLLVVLVLVANHAVARFTDPPPPERERGIGFMADMGSDDEDD
jgi:hypothetical protein